MSKRTLPPDVADRVLDGLENDPAFRQRFSANPRAALAEKGYAEAADLSIPHDDGMWACIQVSKLPSAQDIGSMRNTLHAKLTSEASYQIFNQD